MEKPRKRKRSSIWLEEDETLLKQLVRERLPAIENKNTDANTNVVKKKAWLELEKCFNSSCKGATRSVSQLKSQWVSTKVLAKKEMLCHPEKALSINDVSAWLPNEYIVNTNDFDSDISELSMDSSISVKMEFSSMENYDIEKEVEDETCTATEFEEYQEEAVEQIYKKINMSTNNPPIINSTQDERTGQFNLFVIKSQILSGELKISDSRGLSKVWKIFGKIEDINGKELPRLVACRNCKNIYKYNSKSTSNLVKHKCYTVMVAKNRNAEKVNVDNDCKNHLTNDIREWTVRNCRPFTLVEDCGFKKVAERLILIGSKYGANVNMENLLPHPTTVSRKLTNIYNTCFEKVKEEIVLIKNNGFGLTSDLWTDDFFKKTYIALTIHYTKDREIVSRLLGMICMEGQRSTSENVESKVIKLLSEFKLEFDNKSLIVTDRGSNMVAAFRNNNHLFCVNHLLHNTIHKSVEDEPDIANLAQFCSKLVRFFEVSGLNYNLNTALKGCSPTRWNNIYYECLSVEKNWTEIVKTLQQKGEYNRLIAGKINLNLLAPTVKILEEFEKASKSLEGDKYPTLNLVYIYIYKLKKICNSSPSDIPIIRNFKEKLRTYLDSEVFTYITVYHKIALFLFPPFNKLVKFSDEEKKEVKDECKRLMEIYEISQEEHSSDLQTIVISDENNSLYCDFMPNVTSNPTDRISCEISSYEELKTPFHDDFNILEWWDLHKTQFPLLFKVSCRILATPASSAASERAFSVGRNLITEKRSRIAINDSTVNRIMFLNSNLQDEDLQLEINEDRS